MHLSHLFSLYGGDHPPNYFFVIFCGDTTMDFHYTLITIEMM